MSDNKGKTLEEKWQIYQAVDGKWYWHLCIPFAAEHGPFEEEQHAVANTRLWLLVDLYEEAAANEANAGHLDGG